MGVSAILGLVCKALGELAFTWNFSSCSPDQARIDGSVMAVCGSQGDAFLIFFHSAIEMPSVPSIKYYAMDFGVKKHEGVCHLNRFDAISEAYEAIVAMVNREAHSTNSLTKNTPEPVSQV